MIVIILNNLSTFTVFIAVIVGASKYKLLRRELKILVWYFILVFFIEVIALYKAKHHINNMLLFHIFTPLEYSALMLIFSYWQKEKMIKWAIRLSIPLFLIFNIYSKSFWENVYRFDNISTTIESVLLIGISFYTLIELNKEEISDILKDSRFWVCFGVLFYFLSSLVVFAFSALIFGWSVNKLQIVFSINAIVDIIANLLYTKSFICDQRPIYI